jgi:carbohydrate-binding DOMON domain-containing protein
MLDALRRAGGCLVALGLALVLATPAATAQKVSFKDPKDDDNGPGKYTYPTDPAYRPGSFDLTGFRLRAHGDKVDLDVDLAAKLDDPWKTGSGFSLQMVFVFIQSHGPKKEGGEEPAPGKAGAKKPPRGGKTTAGKAAAEKGAANKTGADKAAADKAAADQASTGQPGTATGDKAAADKTSGAKTGKTAAGTPAAGDKAAPEKPGFTAGPPGLGIQFAPEDGWDRCIILSPLPASRVRDEVATKAAAMKDAIVIPSRVRGSGRTISVTIDRKALGPGDPTDWGYQVVIAGSDAFPAADSLLVRKVNETESQHRFGGGTDGACNPNVLDVLAGDGEGEPGEVAEQHDMLLYECNPDNTPKKPATLKMVRVDKSED